MPPSKFTLSTARRMRTGFVASLCVAALAVPMVASQETAAAAATALPVNDSYRASADIGFHDYTRDGSEREIRNDLTGDLGAMVEFAQMTTVDPTDNAANEGPTLVADRIALLMVTPTTVVDSLKVEVKVKGEVKGTVDLAHPNLLPDADQSFDSRGTVAYSLRAWSVELPYEWVQPGITLTVTDGAGRTGTLDAVDVGAPREMVINNIRLGMLTFPPVANGQRFLNDPASGATDYFQTIPLSRLTMAKYEDVELDKVIVHSGDIYTVDSPDPRIGSVYAGTMRENVGKAQVSTGINLATWGITSSPMNQRQPGSTNQRVIHHSAGLYSNGRHRHGLSGGNGMATLYDSVGNELSHELGHSYGIGHYPGVNNKATGDDIVRDASHNMDSGWGYIAYRGLMRSNLDQRAYRPFPSINGMDFRENLAGRYNFNTDAMAGGWDASPVSDYTHHTRYTLKRIQTYLRDLVADTSYPSGYRDWDEKAGAWVDAKQANPEFNMLAPKQVGVPVFTLLGGYNPAKPEQTLMYPAFRSNYGVTFDLPQVDPQIQSYDRACWVEVTFQNAATQYIALDASDGVKQLNVNIAESERPTGAQISCRVEKQTTNMGEPITIATDLEPMPAAVVVGMDDGFDALREQELRKLEATLLGLENVGAPVLSVPDMIILQGWADDLSPLSMKARRVAERILQLTADALTVEAYLAEHGGKGVTAADLPELASFLEDRGYADADGAVDTPAGSAVTVNQGRCLYLDDKNLLRVDADQKCADNHKETWFVDIAGRIHSAQNPNLCVTHMGTYGVSDCSLNNIEQRWVLNGDSTVVRASNTRSAMDYNRKTSYVTSYGVSGTTNQYWVGFKTNTNPLLAYLSADGLALLAGTKEVDKPAVEAPVEGNPAEEVPVDETPTEVPDEPVTGGIGDAIDEIGSTPVDDETPAEGEQPVEGDKPAEGEKPAEGDKPVEGDKPAEGEQPAPVESDAPVVEPGENPDVDAPNTEAPAPDAGDKPAAPVEGGIGDAVGAPTPTPTPAPTETDPVAVPDAAPDGAGNVADETAVGGVSDAVGGETPPVAVEPAGDLATTGGSPAWIALGAALALLLSGGAVLMIRRVRS
ncbi:M66 family metalloprotease [Microbacterium sp. A82]|uniref:M66 family metalloprotease n=1 Tax=Microbacterium sp. A82 TaxID=3450452 RepID=UPI003F2D2EDF